MKFVEPFATPAWHLGTPRFLRRLLRIVVLDLIVLAVLIGGGEWVVRSFVPRADRFLFSEDVTAGRRIVLNAEGLREREIPAAKGERECRILMLGDSIAFGTGIEGEAAIPRALERAVAPDTARAGATCRVINAGRPGSPLSHRIEFLRARGFEYQPDLVVLAATPSMISSCWLETMKADQAMEPATVAPAVSRWTCWKAVARRPLRAAFEAVHAHSCLYTLAAAEYRAVLFRLQIRRQSVDAPTGGLLAYAFDEPAVDRERVEKAYAQFERQLQELKSLLDDRGIPLVLMGVPSRFEIGETSSDNLFQLDRDAARINPLARYRAFCDESGIAFVDLTPRLRDCRARMERGGAEWDDLYVELDYAHLNAAGCEIAADVLRDALAEDARLAVWQLPRAAQQVAGKQRVRAPVGN